MEDRYVNQGEVTVTKQIKVLKLDALGSECILYLVDHSSCMTTECSM